jgi:plastocyanin
MSRSSASPGPRTARLQTRTKQTLALLSALTLVLAVGLLAASCGGDSTTTTAGVGTTASAPGTTGGSGAGRAQVVMRNLAFDPATVTIQVGESVTWTNQDSMDHTIVADNGEFESSVLAGGAAFSFTFDTAGTYAYHCGIHPSMTGEVMVQ